MADSNDRQTDGKPTGEDRKTAQGERKTRKAPRRAKLVKKPQLTLYESAVASIAPSTEDIAYIHPIFAQCFLPIRPSDVEGQTEYVRTNGKWTLRVQTLERETAGIPAGGKARLILAFINDAAYRTRNRRIEMGGSMRDWLARAGITSTGKSHKALAREVNNVLAAHFTFVERRSDGQARHYAQVAQSIDFWVEPQTQQSGFWLPEVVLTTDYFNAVCSRNMPLDFRVYAALHRTPVLMDLYSWLVYRLPQLRWDTKISIDEVMLLFGQGYTGQHARKDFMRKLRKQYLPKILEFYPDARFELEKDYLTLKPSRSPYKREHMAARSALPHRRRPSEKSGDVTPAQLAARAKSDKR